MTVRSGVWEATGASVRGAAHERDGRPNQDSVRVVDVGGATPGLVAAVCDGHGGERYVRSDVGSRFGSEVACDVGKWFLAAFGGSDDLADIRHQLRTRVVESVVERWRDRVMDDVHRRPFSDDERARARTRSDLDGEPLISYGCTLVLAIAGPTWVAFVQIGDGDVTVVRADDAEGPMPTDDRLVGGETTSLCLPTAVADARVEVLGDPLPDIVILTSDGYANSFASPTWRSDIGLDLRRQLDDYGLAEIEAHLPGWLVESARAGGDDVSMALVRRREPHATLRDAVPVAASSGRPDAPGAAPSAPPQRRRRVPSGALLAAVPALAIGIGGGWLLGRGGDGDPRTAAATTAAATTVTETVAPVTTQPALPTSAPASAPVTASTDPVVTTGAPRTDDGVAIDAPGDVVVLSGTSGDGWLLRFDSSAPQPAEGSVTLLDSVRTSKPATPERWVMNTPWEFDGAELCFGDQPCYPAVGVLWPGEDRRDPDLVWATDVHLLWSFDADSGVRLGCAVVAGPSAGAPAPKGGVASTATDAPLDTDAPSTDAPTSCDTAPTGATTPTGTTIAPDEENG